MNENRALVVVTRPGDGLGFRLAGVTVEEVARGEEVLRLRLLLAGDAPPLLAVEDEILAALPETVVQRAAERGAVLVPFTLPRRWDAPSRPEDYVAALVRRAIGYQIKVEPAP